MDILSLVTPLVGSTIEIRFLAKQFRREDLPTFGLPIMATMGRNIIKAQVLNHDISIINCVNSLLPYVKICG
jgi:hypothetical protein